MTDGRRENGSPPDGFDDDRLLALALGLDDDPELLAAAAEHVELAARLEAMRADVALIAAQVGAAVPAPDEGYTDLSGDRWSGLKELLEPPANAERPRRARRWWRVAAPVTALIVLALVVGVVAVDRGGLGSSGTSDSAEVARPDAGDVGRSTATAQGLAAGADGSTHREGLADPLDRFAVIVLTRARAATGALQRFVVLRVFKGDAPQAVELRVGDEPADEGRLHLLLLDPVATAAKGSVSPEPVPPAGTTKDLQGLPGKPLAVAYTYGGEPTMVRELAAGADPSSVHLPVP